MGRYENDDVSGLDLPDPNTLFIKEFNEAGEIAGPNQWVCAKETANKSTNVVNYYILCAGGQMYNPRRDNDVRYKSRNDWKLTRVRDVAYNLYQQFLQTRRLSYLYQAERDL